VKTLGHAAPIFPYDPPAIVSVPLAFLVAVTVSMASRTATATGATQAGALLGDQP